MSTEPFLFVLAYAGWGLVVGLMVGLTAIGTALLGTPGLIVLFGMPPVTAVGTMAVAGFAMMTAGTAQHRRQGTVVLSIGLPFSVLAVPAAYMTARYATAINAVVPLTTVLGIVIIISVAVLFHRYVIVRPEPRILELPAWKRRIAPFLGLLLGALTGATSISGSLIVIVFIMLLKLPSPHAVGTTAFVAAVSLLPASIGHISQGTVNWIGVIGLLPGVLAGSMLGARYVNHLPRQALRMVILVVLLAAAVMVMIN